MNTGSSWSLLGNDSSNTDRRTFLLSAVMMPGAPVADAVFVELKPRIDALIERGWTPGLGTIMVGDDSASAGYIRMKMEKALSLGFTSPHLHLPEDSTQADLLAAIKSFN